MKAPAEFAGFWSHAADLDELIVEANAVDCSVDLLLEQRLEWQRQRDELLASLDD